MANSPVMSGSAFACIVRAHSTDEDAQPSGHASPCLPAYGYVATLSLPYSQCRQHEPTMFPVIP